MRSTNLGPWLLVGWTLFVWGTRIRNIVNDTELEGLEQLWRAGLAVALTSLALAGAAALMTNTAVRKVISILAAVSIAVWVVRAVGIATGDHSIGFIAVHLMLAAVTTGLAIWSLRSLSVADAPSRKMRTPV